jgi:adenylate kinase
MQIILLGAPGVGKGTQAVLISEKYNIPSISTGELLRKAAANRADVIGQKIKKTIDAGMLVENNLIGQLLADRLQQDDCSNGFILDGFPRSIEQAHLMSIILPKNCDKCYVIDIQIETQLLIKRLSGRFTCSNCNQTYNKFFLLPKKDGICDNCSSMNFIYRADDNEDIIRKRMNVYNSETKPLIEYYSNYKNANEWIFKTFDGNKNVAKLFSEILEYLND